MSGPDIFKQLRLQKMQILDEYHAEVQRLHGELEAKLKAVRREAAKAAKDSGTMPCLVRWTAGPDLTVYHSDDASCGRVRERANFHRMNECSAKNASPYVWLERCSACIWSRAALIHGKRMLEAGGE